MRLVVDDDLDPPADRIVATIRQMGTDGRAVSPATVSDQLMRRPANGPTTAVLAALRDATTRRVCPEAARDLGAAVVARSLRRRIESAGHAMQSAAYAENETDLVPMVAHIAASVAECGHRLALLRGEAGE
ncbi:hypothetical protein [Mycolicibacterium psychrotolerans]|uniref:hypothetical protein n=1 Tax=Mycolicibacterium psychrotolerans TaxID=216929 RepID=UPI0013D09402|nr:hypothetical protein [Mycolicibacterium psychrotolerans]